MIIFDRENKNILSSWWWTVDRLSLLCIGLIIAFGAIMVTTASPAVAEHLGKGSFYFVKRQFVFLILSIFTIFFASLASTATIRRIGLVGFLVSVILLVIVLVLGAEANGAKRWLSIFGFSLQPSEFMKPFFIITIAWVLSESKIKQGFKGFKISMVLYILLVALLMMQPDLGMTIVVSMVWCGQMFLAGLSMLWISGFVVFAIVGALAAYMFFPHVAFRIDTFLDPSGNYQAQKSMDAFLSGGILGRGPGEGVVKQSLPDSHTDFIFAVVGEELGAIVCFMVVIMYAFIVLRGFKRMLSENNLFVVYAVSGLLMQFGLQAMINMGVALNLLPTKGMTLPFVSYGGSSMLAIALAMGMMLALTRRRFGFILRKSKTNFVYEK